MIVRISGEDQYMLADADGRLGELDEAVVEALERDDESDFERTFGALLQYVRSHGQRIPEEELIPSDLILPPPDLTYAEAKSSFSEEGLIPD